VSTTRSTETPSEHQQRRLAQQKRNRRVARTAAIVVGVALVGSSLLQQSSGGYDAAPVLALLVVFFLSLGVLATILVTRGWRWPRMSAKLAGEVLESDRRAPVLYLRPFEADERKHWYAQRIAKAARSIGPVIAVGRPEENLPATPHIAREYLLDEEWHARVLELMRRAQLIVLHVGGSPGLAWEIEQAIGLGRPERLVVCLGPESVPRLGDSPRAGAAYQQFVAWFGHAFPKGLPRDPGASAFLTFTADWTPVPSHDLGRRPGPLAPGLRRLHESLTHVRVT
jgi:hypothetical protein